MLLVLLSMCPHKQHVPHQYNIPNHCTLSFPFTSVICLACLDIYRMACLFKSQDLVKDTFCLQIMLYNQECSQKGVIKTYLSEVDLLMDFNEN